MRPAWILGLVSLGACLVEPPGASFPAATTTAGSTSSSSGAVGLASSGRDGLDSSGTSDGAILDVSPGPPGCIECTLTIASQQSGELTIDGDQVFAIAQLRDHTVYAMGTHGAGRFIAAADSSLPLGEQTDCPLRAWLAGSYDVEPEILVFGWNHADELGEVPVEPRVHLPAEYVGDPERLAEDYDVVVYLEESSFLDDGAEPSDEELQTVLEFAFAGGGLVVSSEYAVPGGGYLTPTDLASVNRILVPLGIEAQAVSLDWGEVEGGIEFPCFPPVG